MYCKFCGMESKNEERCEWCGKLLEQPKPAPTSPGRPPPEPAPGTIPATTTSVVSPGLPTAAVTPEAVEAALDEGPLPQGYRVEHFLALMLPVMLVSMVVAHYVPKAFAAVVLIDLFLLGILMAVSHCIKHFDDEYADVTMVLVAICGLGFLLAYFPLAALVVLAAYATVGQVRREQNTSLLVLLGGYFAVMLVSGLALHGVRGDGGLQALAGFGLVLNFLSVFAVFGGWIVSGFWRPLNQ